MPVSTMSPCNFQILAGKNHFISIEVHCINLYRHPIMFFSACRIYGNIFYKGICCICDYKAGAARRSKIRSPFLFSMGGICLKLHFPRRFARPDFQTACIFFVHRIDISRQICNTQIYFHIITIVILRRYRNVSDIRGL